MQMLHPACIAWNRRNTGGFSSEHCVLDSFVGAQKDAGVFCILVLRFNKVQPSLQPQRVLESVGLASSGEPQGLRTDPTVLVTPAAVGGWAAAPCPVAQPWLCPPSTQLRVGRELSASNRCLRPRHVGLFSGPGSKAGGSLGHLEDPSHHHLPRALLGLCPGSSQGHRCNSPVDACELCMNRTVYLCTSSFPRFSCLLKQ